MKKLCVFAFVAMVSTAANSAEWIKGKITSIESSYLPGVIVFVSEGGSVSCPSGKTLKWQKPDIENNKMVYSTLLAAMLSGKSIHLFINDGDTNCVGQYIYILNN